MRVIAGRFKKTKLVAPKTFSTRPVLDQVKEAIFNILFNISDMQVLDLFAGSGSMGIEALSRDAAHCTFVENGKLALKAISENIAKCSLQPENLVIPTSVQSAITQLEKKKKSFDLIFVDPPYLKNLLNPTLAKLAKSSLIHEESIIVAEHHPKEPIEADKLGLVLTDERRYGQTLISFLALCPQKEEDV
ncbi:MAG: 16S rRNA (guanine(966)-N(2))-methyltransferase RsmD [Deltaproteobacteria bacterium CG_4_10_14_0_2_um_filter_43_8]|nr:MAG: 16S rRNA (guanine(966)-N(2))-methyltransferase RsmD [Deltaproteobacteria bacterium CG11_big_fil_rev_8_21_14_0_20_42_23]PJA19953.1 MAG: 16S rRNA (guanine(966)-N(2))-methyltransferase RsmD [Deltaproteobacteria bacterium CG_4_10_14_0_2_um_filter_43_8]PJC63605.1 MAG: 16S rRNA (guanine(966)-N(2))-methyltransferase RsmD [Deltaproteobacteria bacterium CG_4_9_14_0_2_um_filter_42_21]